MGETVFEAVSRELKEECGITPYNGKIIAIIDKIYKTNEKIECHYCIIDFLFEKFQGNPKPGSDALEVKFFSLDKISNKEDIVKSVKCLITKTNFEQAVLPIYMKFLAKSKKSRL